MEEADITMVVDLSKDILVVVESEDPTLVVMDHEYVVLLQQKATIRPASYREAILCNRVLEEAHAL